MRTGIATVVAGLVLVAAGLGAALILEPAAPKAAAQRPASAVGIPVTVGVVTPKDLPVFLHGIGTVQAFKTDTISSRVDGQIIGSDFTEGQEVAAGTLLFQIDPRPYQAVLAQAEAAKAKDVAQLQSAQADFGRSSKLIQKGYQTRQIYDQQKALVAQLEAAIAGDQAQIDAAKLNVSYCDIRAPISGRLGARLVDIGNLVHGAASTPLVTLSQVRPIFVSFTLPQENFDEVRQHQIKTPLVVEALSGDDKQELAKGTLTLIDNKIDLATGTIHLKAQFTNEDERLWPGEFVNVRVLLSLRHGVPTVPSEAVQDGPEGHVVYVVRADDTVERRAVEVATIEDGLAAVTKGLSPGERVVVRGQYRLTNGARINPTAPAPSADAG